MQRMTVHDTHEMRPDEYPDQPDKMTDLSVDQKLANVTNLRPTVGDELRMRREEAGHTINDVSEAVRIQPRYLEALEKGRLEDLPGTVYALGFLRTYAEHYGFNGGAFVTRFKEETEGLRREQDFSLPEPIEDARVPTAAIFIVAIVLAIGAYVAWYNLGPQDAKIADAVPNVPANLSTGPEPYPTAAAPVEIVTIREPVATEVDAPVASATSPEVPAAVDAPATVAVTEAPPMTETPPATVESLELPASPPEPEAPTVEAPPAVAPVAESTVAEIPVVETPVVEEPAVPVNQPLPVETPIAEASPVDIPITEAPPTETPVTGTPAAETPPAVEIATITSPELPATDTPQAPAVEETPHVPQSFGAGNADARIVITAIEDSWLEITDVEGNRLLSRTMRAGDSYRVPDRQGLVLVTGNAGGLKFAVDGAATPAIGDTGIVRKNVKLDPDLLKQGRAWP
jgi:cytoskeleton protein RodZ